MRRLKVDTCSNTGKCQENVAGLVKLGGKDQIVVGTQIYGLIGKATNMENGQVVTKFRAGRGEPCYLIQFMAGCCRNGLPGIANQVIA